MADDIKKKNREENTNDQENKMSDKKKLIDEEKPESTEQSKDSKEEKQNSDDSKSNKEPLENNENKTKKENSDDSKSQNEPQESQSNENKKKKKTSDDSKSQKEPQEGQSNENKKKKKNSDDSKGTEEPQEGQSKENKEENTDDKDLEEPNAQEEFLKKQKKLLDHVSNIEKKHSDQSELRPCDSCELLKPFPKDDGCCARLCFWRKRKIMPNLFWIISVPGDPNPQEAFDKLKENTEAKKLSLNYKFHIPQLKIGTLDELMFLTEELKSLDSFTRDIIHKFAEFVREVSEGKSENVQECFQVHNMDVATYITRFTWNPAKFGMKKPLSVLHDLLRAEVRRLGETLKTRMNDFHELDRTLDKIEKQQTGSLLTRSLAGIVKKEHFILDSGYLTTLLVVVSKHDEKKWLKSYQGLADMVVPQSAMMIFEDKNQLLYSVVLCKKSMDDFKNNAREQRFLVRDFEYNEVELNEEKNIQKRLQKLKKSQISVLRRWIKVNFGEGFASWMHIKALVILVESVVRFGLPRNFQATILVPLVGKEQLRTVLNELYCELDNDLSSGKAKDVPGALAGYGVTDYAPYVFSKIKFDSRLSKKKE